MKIDRLTLLSTLIVCAQAACSQHPPQAAQHRPASQVSSGQNVAAQAANEAAPRILMIVTSHDRMGDGGEKTGIWLEELAAPLHEFVEGGAQVDIASPRGGEIPVDPRSRGEDSEAVRWFFQRGNGEERLKSAARLDESKTNYDGYFVVGGHGAMWDLPRSEAVAKLLGAAYDEGKVVSAVCHGPAALVNVRLASGRPLLEGKRATAFSNSEEKKVKLDKVVPFALQSKLEDLGARYEASPDFAAHAIRDERLITGQNPASSAEVAKLVLSTIAERPRQGT